MAGVLEDAVALAVPDDVRLTLANRQRCSGPDRAGIFIAKIDYFSGRIADSVVGPRRETILAAVERPRATTAGFGDLKPKLHRVADHITPGRRCQLFRTEEGDVFASALMKPAETVEEREIGWSNSGFGICL